MSEGLGSNTPSNGESSGWFGNILNTVDSIVPAAASLGSSYLNYKTATNNATVTAQTQAQVQSTQWTTIMYLGLGVIAVVIIYKIAKG